MITDFEVDGGRYGGTPDQNGRVNDCDTCDAECVPCIFFPAAEDCSGSSVCESCVKRMLAAFEADKLKFGGL